MVCCVTSCLYWKGGFCVNSAEDAAEHIGAAKHQKCLHNSYTFTEQAGLDPADFPAEIACMSLMNAASLLEDRSTVRYHSHEQAVKGRESIRSSFVNPAYSAATHYSLLCILSPLFNKLTFITAIPSPPSATPVGALHNDPLCYFNSRGYEPVYSNTRDDVKSWSRSLGKA